MNEKEKSFKNYDLQRPTPRLSLIFPAEMNLEKNDTLTRMDSWRWGGGGRYVAATTVGKLLSANVSLSLSLPSQIRIGLLMLAI